MNGKLIFEFSAQSERLNHPLIEGEVLSYYNSFFWMRFIKRGEEKLIPSSNKMYLEPLLKVSFNSDMNNPVKTPTVLKV